jgi:hypothetical protein
MRASPRVCRAFGKKRNYPECHDSGCSRGSSSYEPIEQTGCKPVERIDLVGINATTITSDHPRSRWKSIHRRYERIRHFCRNMKSIRYERGQSLHSIHDRKSIYINDTRGRSLHMFTEKFTTRILWHAASKLIREKETA